MKKKDTTESLCLSKEELLELKVIDLETKVMSTSSDRDRAFYLAKNLEIQLLKKNIQFLEIECKNLQESLETSREDLCRIVASRKGLIISLQEKYKLPDKWGYDPDTGVVSTSND